MHTRRGNNALKMGVDNLVINLIKYEFCKTHHIKNSSYFFILNDRTDLS